MADALQFGAALIGFLTAIAAAIPTAVQYWTRKKGSSKTAGRRFVRAFAWITKPRSILLGIGILASVSALLLLQITHSDDESHSFAENLLRQLADEDAHECEITPTRIDTAIASLQCLEDKPMRTVTISLFATTSDLKRVEQERLATLKVEAGDCTTQQVAWQKWQSGKLFCDYSDTAIGARIQWSRYDSNTWLEAEGLPGVSPERVYDWWIYDDNGAPANNRLPYPDRYERYISDTTHIPASECMRASGYKNSLAAINCEHPGFKTLFFGYYSDAKSLHEALGTAPGKGSCVSTYHYDYSREIYLHREPEVGRRAYELHGARAGTRDCYNDSKNREVVVEWTNQERGLFGYAEWTGSHDLESLFYWWKKKGRFLTD